MPGNFSKLVTVVTGQTITAAERNNEVDNIINNMTPDGLDDASANLTEMQATTDPFPAGSASQATDLRGELRRLRYQMQFLTSDTYWYQDPLFLAALDDAATPGATAATLKIRLDQIVAQLKKLNANANWYDTMAWLSALDQAASPGSTGTSLKNRLDMIVTQLKAIMGTTNWYDAVAVTLLAKLSLVGGTMSGDIAMGTNKVTGIGDGSAAQDAAAFNQIQYVTPSTPWASYAATFGSLGTIANRSVWWKRINDTTFVKGYVVSGTPTGTALKITLPNTIDTNKFPTTTTLVGQGRRLHSAAGPTTQAVADMFNLFYDGSTNDGIFVAFQSGSAGFTKNVGSALLAAADGFSFEFSYPNT